jgi:Cu2+-exporting ATPase
MHPEIIQDHQVLVLFGYGFSSTWNKDSEESKVYQDLWRKMKIALFFTVPIFIISMSDMIPNNPLLKSWIHKHGYS